MAARLRLRLHAPLRGIAAQQPAGPAEPAPALPARLAALELAAARERDEHAAVLRAMAALGDAAKAARAEVAAALAALARQAVELGLAVAREIVGDAVGRGGIDPLPAVLRCLESAAPGAELEIRLAPADLERVMSRIAADPELRARTHGCAFSADPGLACGHVQARCGLSLVAHDPREVFERVAAAVRGAAGA